MQQYLSYLFQTFIIKSTSPIFNSEIKEELLNARPFDLTKYYKSMTSSQQLFNQISLLLVKGVLKYSPANLNIQLSLPNLLIYQRLFKVQLLAQKYLDPSVTQFVHQFIQQGLQNGMGFPIKFSKKRLQKIFTSNHSEITKNQSIQQAKKKSKSKPKQNQPTQQKLITNQQPEYNYHKLIYQYKSAQLTTQINQLNTEKKVESANSHTKKTKTATKEKHQSKENQDQEQYMLNIEELTKLLQAAKYIDILNAKLGPKEKKLSLFEFLNMKERENIISEIKYQKIEEYINQILGTDCLLVFNLVKKCPFITEKQLSRLTLLQILQTRASLNKLIEKGLVYFYNQNARTVVYKVVTYQILESKYLDLIGRTLLNLSLFGQRFSESAILTVSSQKNKQKMIQIECQLQRLDDLILLFGY